MKQQAGIELSVLMDGLVEPALQDRMRGLLVEGIALDSRRVTAGGLFLALPGRQTHGLAFAAQAVENGARVVLWGGDESAETVSPDLPAGTALFRIEALREKCSEIAARYFDHPSRKLYLVGVTGTDGKTSVSHYLAQCLHSDTAPCGVLGTLGNGLIGQLQDTGLTTADAVQVQQSLAALVEQGARHAVMEVSSHGLDQSRVAAVAFDSAVFTNLAQDHLDYHGDMVAYASAKERLFYHSGLRSAAVNLDDPVGRSLARKCAGRMQVWGYRSNGQAGAVSGIADHVVEALDIEADAEGLAFTVRAEHHAARVRIGLLGRFNVSNALAVLATLLASGVDFAQAVERLAALRPVPGRMQWLPGSSGPAVIVDYAHTPQALQASCLAVREHFDAKLVCVFGCGGDRDRRKRPLMAAAAEAHADVVVVTSDNPRSEHPQRIVDEILQGLQAPEKAVVRLDRGEAIEHAIRLAGESDVVLIAGKGHESYQIIGNERLAFNDAEVASRLLEVRP